ncbi:MAG: DNA-processing protein DprA [Gammaproteobacteria bacterium]|nr:DNA-processing protein DprA [Gammaproteobacteria bacterium]
MDRKQALLLLNRIPNVGPRTIKKLLNDWPNLKDIFDLSIPDLIQAGLSEQLAKKIVSVEITSIEKELRWQESPHHALITWADADYPALLREIPDAPPVLYASGLLDCLTGDKLAMIGTRTPSTSGAEAAFNFAYELGAHAITIVSGLARGIDGQAHRGCLLGKGKTIAILGAGIDCIYPRQHARLAEEIQIEGLLLSEFPLGTAPLAGHFPRRNRIISGLSLATLVVEASLKSGSLITAHLALEQNRSVMALPGSIHNPQAKGCHTLLQQGAALVTSPREVLEELCVERRFRGSGKELDSSMGGTGSLTAYIGFEVTTVDSIVDRSSLPVEDVITDLAELELQGQVKAVPGGYIRCI